MKSGRPVCSRHAHLPWSLASHFVPDMHICQKLISRLQACGQVKAAKINVLQRDEPKPCVQQAG